uniref:MFS transporter n=1 Tax=Cupriavidus necator TaxID=106590 RepID=UPI003F494868
MLWKNHPRAVMACLLALHVLAHIDRNMLLGFSPQITRDLSLSNAQYGLLAGAVWVLSYGVMALVMGSLADRYSRTRVMAAGILIWSVCTAASGAAHSFEAMVAARFLVASGEAALVPAAVSLIAELFSERRRGSAMGMFFTGIPLGIGFSFVLAGTIGATQGWRDTFFSLGVVGAVVALLVSLLKDERGGRMKDEAKERGAPLPQQLRAVWTVMRGTPVLTLTVVGFVLIHFLFAGLSFVQLWLVHERGVDPAGIARQLGMLQIVFGTLGALGGGILSDRLARYVPGGRAGFMALLVLLCVPLQVAFRFSTPGSALFYVGMCAGLFLPMALYGPSLSLIQGLTPPNMRSTITGAAMLLLNIFAIAIGNALIGAVSDSLTAAGYAQPLTLALLGSDLLAFLALFAFLWVARGMRRTEPACATVC